MQELTYLFGNVTKVRIIRLFLFHPKSVFTTSEVRKRVGGTTTSIQKVLKELSRAGLLEETKKRVSSATSEGTDSSSKKAKGRQVKGWKLDRLFPYLRPLKDMMLYQNLVTSEEVVKRFKRTGNVKLLLTLGVFVQDDDAPVDILVVGEKIDTGAVLRAVKSIEADIGTELSYSIFSTKEYQYRVDMHDKLVREVRESDHNVLVNKIS